MEAWAFRVRVTACECLHGWLLQPARANRWKRGPSGPRKSGPRHRASAPRVSALSCLPWHTKGAKPKGRPAVQAGASELAPTLDAEAFQAGSSLFFVAATFRSAVLALRFGPLTTRDGPLPSRSRWRRAGLRLPSGRRVFAARFWDIGPRGAALPRPACTLCFCSGRLDVRRAPLVSAGARHPRRNTSP